MSERSIEPIVHPITPISQDVSPTESRRKNGCKWMFYWFTPCGLWCSAVPIRIFVCCNLMSTQICACWGQSFPPVTCPPPARGTAPFDGQRTATPDSAGACHHPEHPGRAAAQVHEPAVVPAEPAADRLGGAAGGSGCVRCLTELCALDHPCHVSVAFGALAHQQEVATLDGAAEIGDRCFVTAVAAPDVGQQPLADVGRD